MSISTRRSFTSCAAVLMVMSMALMTTNERTRVTLRRQQNAAPKDVDNGVVLMQRVLELVRYVPTEDNIR